MDPEIEAARIKDELRHMTSADFFMQTLNKEWRVQDAKAKAQQIAAERQSRRLVRGLPGRVVRVQLWLCSGGCAACPM